MIIGPIFFLTLILYETMKFLRPSETDWMFCKMDRGMFSICSSIGCPPFIVYSLGCCFEWKKYCQIHSTHILYFSWKENHCVKYLKRQNTAENLLLCCCLFNSDPNGILFISVSFYSYVSPHCRQGTWSNHMWFLPQMTVCVPQSQQLVVSPSMWFILIHSHGSNDAWDVLKIQTGSRSGNTNSSIKCRKIKTIQYFMCLTPIGPVKFVFFFFLFPIFP